MTDEQIVKDMGTCIKYREERECGNCSRIGRYQCAVTLMKDAFDLINRKDAEIERLKEYETALKKGCALSRCINKGFVQDEAYKEFAERLKEKATSTFYEERKYVDTEDIDWVYEELTRNLHGTCTEGGNEDG